MATNSRVAKNHLASFLLDVIEDFNERPADEVLRQDGIPEPVIAELNQMGQHLLHAIELLQEEG